MARPLVWKNVEPESIGRRYEYMKWLIVLVLVISGANPVSASASESGVAVRNCKVMNEPFADAREIASLKAGDPVSI